MALNCLQVIYLLAVPWKGQYFLQSPFSQNNLCATCLTLSGNSAQLRNTWRAIWSVRNKLSEFLFCKIVTLVISGPLCIMKCSTFYDSPSMWYIQNCTTVSDPKRQDSIVFLTRTQKTVLCKLNRKGQLNLAITTPLQFWHACFKTLKNSSLNEILPKCVHNCVCVQVRKINCVKTQNDQP